ncbi:MAG: glutaredoxin [bacterium]|nr:glutaredoxin [bacterium]
MLDEQLKEQIKKKLSSEMKGDVKLILFGEGDDCSYCLEYKELVEELASLSENLSPEIYPFSSPEREKHGVDIVPSLVVYSEEHNSSATFCGPPSSHFFPILIEDIIDASRGSPSISKEIIEKVKSIDFPVKIRVFASQTCPHCPPAVKVAHDFSLINPKIKAQMINSSFFQELCQRYNVRGVPKTIINDKMEFTGAQPPSEFLKYLFKLRENP